MACQKNVSVHSSADKPNGRSVFQIFVAPPSDNDESLYSHTSHTILHATRMSNTDTDLSRWTCFVLF